MASRKHIRRELKKRLIIDVATDAFAQSGILSATLDQIGEKLGLTKASLYYYYKSKDELILDVLKAVLEQINEEAGRKSAGEDNPLVKLKLRCFTHVAAAMHSPSGQLVASNLDILTDSKPAAALLRAHEEPARKLLQEAVDQGLLRKIDVNCATKLLFGALNNIPKWYNRKHGTLEDAFEKTWEIFRYGVIPASAPH